MTDVRYPVGKFEQPKTFTDNDRQVCLQQIAEAPSRFRTAFKGLTDSQLDTPYRDGGWTVRQVAHHVPDSHMNAYVRCRLALTEQAPAIKPYNEARWAELLDARSAPIEPSLSLLESLHFRWVMLLKSLAPAEFKKPLVHPEHGTIDIDFLVQLYAWHGRHHTAHITSLRQRKGW